MDMHGIISALLPEDLKGNIPTGTEEIRLRLGREATALVEGRERCVRPGRAVSGDELRRTLDRACGGSVHSVMEELRRGYITAAGGVRIGICGMGTAAGVRDISSLAIRIPRQVPGAGAEVMGRIKGSVLIISPPGGGKTTFLRELIRRKSEGGCRVAVCDERLEISGMHRGVCGFELGRSTDVLCGVNKAEGMLMLLRGMNPQIIAVDEISAPEDIAAVELCANCGEEIFATAHGLGVESLRKRPLYRRLLELEVFTQAVIISGTGSGRKYEVEELC